MSMSGNTLKKNPVLDLLSNPDEQKTILVVDDNISVIKMLSSILQSQGDIIFATTGEAGIKLAKERKPNLILLDIEMPGISGYEVCRFLKRDPETSETPVIFVTAHTSMEKEIEALEAGAVDFITKPMNPLVVQARVKTHLKLQEYNENIRKIAERDGLTGLYNRRYFDEMMDKEIQRHRRQQNFLTLAIIDVDHFKAYNDTYGHQAGDSCLKRIASSIRDSAQRAGEISARYGGEEFAVILPNVDDDNALKYGSWLCNKINELELPHKKSPTSDHVTISIGLCAVIPDGDFDKDKFISLADQALYEAKDKGRNGYVLAQNQ